MGCNCGGTKTAPVKFVYTHPVTGAKTVYTSEVQARAAQIRNKGGTYAPAR
jgi:hypothetical protein